MGDNIPFDEEINTGLDSFVHLCPEGPTRGQMYCSSNEKACNDPARVGLFLLAPALLSDPRYVPKADLPNLAVPNVLPESTQPNNIETAVTVTVTTLGNEKIPTITITQDDVQTSSSTTAISKTIATADIDQSNSEASITSIGTRASHVNHTALLPPSSSSTATITTASPPGAPTTCPSQAQTKLTTGTSTGVPIAAAFIGAVIWALRERRLRNRAESSRAQDPGGMEDDDTTEAGGQGPNLTTSQRY
ncbi:hypothetical protein XPA_004317 [Xanthoria parietina]